MAVQLQVAYSQSIFGTRSSLAGSLNPAQGYYQSGSGIPLQTLIDYTNSQAAAGTIDPTSNIANKPIYMFSGINDTTVRQPVMNTLQRFYETYTSSSNIAYNQYSPAAHAWISLDGPNSCTNSYVPYMNNCGMDPEQTFLTNFYGSLNAKNTGILTGSYIQFDQNAFASGGYAKSYSMAIPGWLFMPQNCADGQVCRLIVALHGCLQYQGTIQQQFVQKSGINERADTNNIFVLHPQATSSSSSNPLGCWGLVGIPRLRLRAKERPSNGCGHGNGRADHQWLQAGQVMPAGPEPHVLRSYSSSRSLSWNASFARASERLRDRLAAVAIGAHCDAPENSSTLAGEDGLTTLTERSGARDARYLRQY